MRYYLAFAVTRTRFPFAEFTEDEKEDIEEMFLNLEISRGIVVESRLELNRILIEFIPPQSLSLAQCVFILKQTIKEAVPRLNRTDTFSRSSILQDRPIEPERIAQIDDLRDREWHISKGHSVVWVTRRGSKILLDEERQTSMTTILLGIAEREKIKIQSLVVQSNYIGIKFIQNPKKSIDQVVYRLKRESAIQLRKLYPEVKAQVFQRKSIVRDQAINKAEIARQIREARDRKHVDLRMRIVRSVLKELES